MRIAYVSFEYPPDSTHGGIATYVLQISRVMADRGHEVEVFASSPTRDATETRDGIRVRWIRETDRLEFAVLAGHEFARRHAAHPFHVLEGPEYLAEARKAADLVPCVPYVVKMHTPSVLLTRINSRQGAWAGARHVLATTVRAGFSLATSGSTGSMHLRRFAESSDEIYRLEAREARKASVVAPPCQDLAKFARDEWRVPEERVALAPHPYIPNPNFLRIDPPTSVRRFGFVGRLERRKGIETLIDAAAIVLAKDPGVEFELIGAPMERASGQPYDRWIHERLGRLMPRVRLSGKVPLERMPAAYAALDACVFPSIWENFPNVCLEAMSAGRPIVASSAGGMREMLDHGRAGILVDPQRPLELATAILNLVRQPSLAVQLGAAARERVLSEYGADRVGARMEAVFDLAIRSGRPGAT